MYPVRVKICGIKSVDEAEVAVNAGAHALGFVFAESPRKITPEQVKTIIMGIPPYVMKVGVFVNENAGRVQSIAKYCGLNILQFHGEETPEYCAGFPGFKIIKAFPVAELSEGLIPGNMASYHVDALLLDTYYPHKKGGGGKAFNWDAACAIKDGQGTQTPFILAGGLRPENITEALNTVRPFGVDVSSGVEKDGKKNPEEIRRFMSRVHGWNEQYSSEKCILWR